MLRVAFDIGGCLSKHPELQMLLQCLLDAAGVEVHVISDIKPHEKAVAFCHDNALSVPKERIHCANYDTHGERCKEFLCDQLGIDILIDDHMAYLWAIGHPPVRLFVMPDPTRDYYDPDWKTDGSEGNFGRRRNPPESKPPRKEPR
jgi:hypothetical protein